MYQKILVPLDGSALAERVIPYVDRLAGISHAEVMLLYAVQPPFFHTADSRHRQTLRINDAADYLAGMSHRLLRAVDVQTIVASGEPANAIAWEATTLGADLIAMSTHGRGGLGRLVHGSVADAVMRYADVPVLLFPAHSIAGLTWPTDRPPRVVIPLDGSDLARSAIPWALDLAGAPGPEIYLIRAVVPVTASYAEGAILLVYDQADEMAEARRVLQQVADGLRGKGLRVTVHPVFGPAAEMIVAAAAGADADVIALSTHGDGGITRLVAGSVASGVIERADRPVLVVRAGISARNLAAADARANGRDLRTVHVFNDLSVRLPTYRIDGAGGASYL